MLKWIKDTFRLHTAPISVWLAHWVVALSILAVLVTIVLGAIFAPVAAILLGGTVLLLGFMWAVCVVSDWYL